MVLSAVTLMMLLSTRRRFDQTSDGRAVRKLTATLATALGVSWGAFLLLGYLLRHGSGTRLEFGGRTQDLPMRFLASMLFSNRFLPANLVGRLLYAGVFLLFWIVALGALTAFFLHTCAASDADGVDRARAILTRGGSTLSYMSTWPGNAYWFSADGRAAIAYRAIVGVALTVGEPYGDPAAFDSAITEFAGFCRQRGLQPCLYSVTARARDVTQRLGWQSVQIAEDTLLPLASLQFSGKKWQGVRAALNKAAREGITAEWWSYPEMPLELLGQIHEISGKWMADKGLPEMNFMLGGLGELNDPNIRCLIAVGADRKLHAVTSWMPVYDSGHSIGWTIDLMRRNTEGTVRGVMEFLIATAALTFQEEGARFVSLSGAPLAGINRNDSGEQPCALAARARHDRQHHGAGLWLPVTAAVQGQVPAGLPAALPDLPRSGRARPDRHRDRLRLPAPPYVPAGPAPAYQDAPAAHQQRPGTATRRRRTRRIIPNGFVMTP